MNCKYSYQGKSIGNRHYLYCNSDNQMCSFVRFCGTINDIISSEGYINCPILNEKERIINEIKSIRLGHVNLKDSFAKINLNNEVMLSNMFIGNYQLSHIVSKQDERASRKLLLHKYEIRKLKQQIDQERLTLVPLSLYFKYNRVKVELALCRGKRVHDKRQAIKERDVKREMDKAIKNRL